MGQEKKNKSHPAKGSTKNTKTNWIKDIGTKGWKEKIERERDRN
jgi:hypothetical protein